MVCIFTRAGAQEPPVLLISPENPVAGAAFRVLAVVESDPGETQIAVTGPSGVLKVLRSRAGGGPPFWHTAEFMAGKAGDYRVSLISGRKSLQSQEFKISATAAPARKPASGVWENRRKWGRESELLYSAWIDALFSAAAEGASWPALHEVTRAPERNLLHNHLGLGEDDAAAKAAVIMEPDCADNPFYLRAYFSWKLGLPFGFHEAGRGTLGSPPRTGRWTTNASPSGNPHPVRAFNSFLREVMNTIHSGAARTRLEDDNSDYYPLALTRAALRPGAVFADPYGHTFTLVRWIPQSADTPGVLLAVDAQPDGTVGIKRFWKGNFLFTTKEVIGEPGFKSFRPIVIASGQSRLLKNKEIAVAPGYGNLSLEQKGMTGDVFYDTMARLINPKPLDPESALLDLLKALHEQLIVRVESVGNGETYMQAHPGTVITMPGGTAGIFLAGGLWEDYSTPNRDLRVLIAIDALLDFPARIVRSPGDYKLSKWKSPEKVKEELEALTQKKAAELTITYIRSNGKPQVLSIKEILERHAAFEVGYNPNDSVEIRWGAPAGSEEIKSCKRKAPAGQLEQMRKLRPWFQKRLHPPT
jgi:hypothetical protein